MQQVNRDVPDFKQVGQRKFMPPGSPIDISPNSGHRSDLSKAGENLRIAHVARMNDVIRSRRAAIASGRSRPCVSEITPIVLMFLTSRAYV